MTRKKETTPRPIERTVRMYKVVDGSRTAKVNAPSSAQAASQFSKIPVRRLASSNFHDERGFSVFIVCTDDLHETDHTVAVWRMS